MKRAILICPKFFGYEENIITALYHEGYMCTYITHRICRCFSFIIQFMPENIQKRIYEKVLMKRLKRLNNDIDLLLVIKGEYLTQDHLSYIQKHNPQIRCVMYQWDSVQTHNYLPLIKFFDRVCTFDIKDSKEYNLQYLPLFYANDIVQNKGIKEDIDFLMVASFKLDRYKYYIRLKQIAQKYNMSLMTHIYVPFGYYIKNQILKNKLHIESVSDIKFKPLPREKLIEYYNRAKIIVDYCGPYQTGFSMRTIESYSCNKKILTTNNMIESDPYIYDIKYLSADSDEYKILDFIECKVPDYQNKNKLSIEQWIKILLNECQPTQYV